MVNFDRELLTALGTCLFVYGVVVFAVVLLFSCGISAHLATVSLIMVLSPFSLLLTGLSVSLLTVGWLLMDKADSNNSARSELLARVED